ncbi:MAG: penicillin acylase family protein [Anaerolineales bacterium]|nr:penicillin acylase family protein [Anaerolineales bacterium]
MKGLLSRIAKIVLSMLLILAILLGSGAAILPRLSFPRINGDVQLVGLDGPVDVIRDTYGIPHIYATTSHDLFFAQGYVHAQDRFYQMDFWRASSTGRLSAMFGKAQTSNDAFIRTVGWGRIAQEEYASLEADARAALDAYAEGVNAYLAEHQGERLSLEYAILGLISPDYHPIPWEGYHSLAWAKVMAYDLGGNMRAEIERSILLKTLSPEQLAEITPPYPKDMPYILPGFNLGAQAAPAELLTAATPDLSQALEQAADQLARLENIFGPQDETLGSNNWVIGGERTAAGLPILANDMHLGEQMPSIWYEVDLQCAPVGLACPYQVTGFSFAGVPGVIVGHNARIAWGFTNVGPDVQDLYVEKINPTNPDQYEYQGQWVNMEIIEDSIQLADGTQQPLKIRLTRHGPLITEVFGGLKDFAAQSSAELPQPYAIALRWAALEQLKIVDAVLGMNQASNWEEFRQAVRDFGAPSQNMVYADVEGNIGYQTPGNIPLRATGHDGLLPVPGWSGEYEWQGYIPFEQLPYTFNPAQGYVATANNAVVDETYPYSISKFWAYGQRARRIVDMIEQAPGLISLDYIARMHGDNKNLNAEALVPLLLQIPLDDSRLVTARDLIQDWDYQDGMDSAASALFNVFWKHLLTATFCDQLPERYWPGGGGRWFQAVEELAAEPQNAWWDDLGTGGQEGRDEIFVQAFAAAVGELENLQGKDPTKWNWGDLHTVTFHHPSLGQSGIGLIEAIFNRGPARTAGGSDIVNATGWSATHGYMVGSVPSERMIVDLSNFDQTRSVITTGQSGHAYHSHYTDQIDPWRLIQYHPLYWSRELVEAHQEGWLRLRP